MRWWVIIAVGVASGWGAGGCSDDGGAPPDGASGGGSAGTSGGGGEAGGGSGEAGGGGGEAGGGSDGCPAAILPGSVDLLALVASGSRLRAFTYRSAGMPDVFAAFYDTQLGAYCDFQGASDGSLRCLPRNAASSAQLGSPAGSCEGNVWELSGACDADGGYRRERVGCGSDRFAIKALIPFTNDTLYFGTADSCSGETNGVPPDAYSDLGDAVDPTTFVAGTRTVVGGPCDAGVVVIEAEDGARAPAAVVDAASQADCTVRTGPCQPLRVAFEDPTLFSDDGCTTMASYGTWGADATCSPPDFVRLADGTLARAGEAVTTPVFSSAGGCEPALDKAFIGAIYAIGEPADLVEFSDLKLGSGRLQVVAVGEGDTPLLATGRFLDTTTGASCEPFAFGDGTTRCVTATIFTGAPTAYSDAACTTAIFNCGGESCDGEIVAAASPDPTACTSEAVTTAWRVRAPHTGVAYRRDREGNCFEAAAPAPTMFNWEADQVDASEFPELTRSPVE